MAKIVKNSLDFNINDNIVINTNSVRIVGNLVESKVVSMEEAKKIAQALGLDLIEINSKVNPPIIRIDDYSKFLFDQKKLAKKNKQKPSQIKEVQLSTNIGSNDLDIKIKKAKDFINDGNKVKVVLTMKGRELSRREESKKSLYVFIDKMSDISVAESYPKDDGNKCIVILKRK